MISFTHLTSLFPKRVSKVYGLNPDGTLRKGETSANVSEATVKVTTVANMHEFTIVLSELASSHCLIYGIPSDGQTKLVTKHRWNLLGKPADIIPRTSDAFVWPPGAGVMMLDYDAPKDGGTPLSIKEIQSVVNKAMNGKLNLVDRVSWSSTSSCLWYGEHELAGEKGQRLYIPVADARDIPRAGKVLSDRLWILGFGRIEISESGSCLERTPVDANVWQTNRIDFAAGAICEDGIEQRRGKPRLINGTAGRTYRLNTLDALPDLTDDEAKSASLAKSIARRAAKPLADAAKEHWIAKRANELVALAGFSPDDSEALGSAITIARRAIENRQLAGDWRIRLESGQEIRVIDILNEPEKYHGTKTFDPIEPDYDGKRVVGKLYLIGGRPNLYSFAHGGVSYRLLRAPARVHAIKGATHEMTLATVSAMRSSRDFYNFDKALVSPGADGKLKVHNADSLFHALGGITQFWFEKINPQTQEPVEFVIDPPLSVVKSVLAMDDSRDIPPLTAITTIPTLRVDGSLLNAAGYDQATGLLFIPRGEAPYINLNPELDEAKRALAYLWQPFTTFPFVDGVDRAAHLAGLLSAIVRPVIPTCPAFAYDAPTQGAGKTLLARCLGILASGDEPAIYAPTDNEEEIRKRLTSILLDGQPAFVWDNVIGQFDSAAIAAFLTAVKSSDRILGASKQVSLPNRSLMMVTGNNLSAVGDMARRIVTARVDPMSSTPFLRTFEMEPTSYCLKNRQSLAAAALTLMRYHFGHCGGERLGPGNTASFEDWDRLVRQSVLRVHVDVDRGNYGDVASLFTASMANDPARESLGQLMQSIVDLVGSDNYVTAAELFTRSKRFFSNLDAPPSTKNAADNFWEALHELSPRKADRDWTVKSLGRVLNNRNGAIFGNWRLACKQAGDSKIYKIESLC